MRYCTACGSSNTTEVNNDRDYTVMYVEYECEFCGHVGQHTRERRSNKFSWRYNLGESPYRKMGKIG